MIAGEAMRALLASLEPDEAAPRMLGARLRASGPDGEVLLRLTEVEAYAGENDPGSHAFRGRTARNAAMFGEAGRLYVYFSYGMHRCANAVVGPTGAARAVLLRGGELLAGAPLARRRRAAFRRPGAPPVADDDLARGPANLARALGIELDDDGADLAGDGRPADAGASGAAYALELLDDAEWREQARPRLRRSPRTGVAAPGGLPPFDWRWYLDGAAGVSPYRPHASVRGASGAHPAR